MTDLIQRIIKLELESIEINQELIRYYTGKSSSMARIIVQNSQEAINNAKESIEFFSKM